MTSKYLKPLKLFLESFWRRSISIINNSESLATIMFVKYSLATEIIWITKIKEIKVTKIKGRTHKSAEMHMIWQKLSKWLKRSQTQGRCWFIFDFVMKEISIILGYVIDSSIYILSRYRRKLPEINPKNNVRFCVGSKK